MLHKTAAGISGKLDLGHSITPCWWPHGQGAFLRDPRQPWCCDCTVLGLKLAMSEMMRRKKTNTSRSAMPSHRSTFLRRGTRSASAVPSARLFCFLQAHLRASVPGDPDRPTDRSLPMQSSIMLSSQAHTDYTANEPPGLHGLTLVPLQTVSGMRNAADVGQHTKTEQRPIISKKLQHKGHPFMMLG